MSNPQEMLIDGKPLSDLRVVDLKDQLDKRGLSKSGTKPVLVERLLYALEMEQKGTALAAGLAGVGGSPPPTNAPQLAENEFVREYLQSQEVLLQAQRKLAEAQRAEAAFATAVTTGPTTVPATEKVEAGKSPPPPVEPRKSSRVRSRDSSQSNEGAVSVQVGSDSESGDLRRIPNRQEPTPASAPDDRSVQSSKAECEAQPAAALNISSPPSGAEGIFSSTTRAGPLAATTEVEELALPTEEAVVQPEPIASVADKIKEASPLVSPHKTESNVARQQKETDRLNVAESQRKETSDEDDQFKERLDFDYQQDDDKVQEELKVETDQPDDTTSRASGGSEAVKEDTIEIKQEKPARKRKWGGSKTTARTTVCISTDSLKDLIGSVSAAEAINTKAFEEQEEAVEEEEAKDSPSFVQEGDGDADSLESGRGQAMDVAPKRIVVAKEEAENGGVRTRISLRSERTVDVGGSEHLSNGKLTDFGLRRGRTPSPPKEASNIIHIRGLTRPFTLNQLNELLDQFGRFDRQLFCIDQKRSNCYVTYGSADEALAARNALQYVEWPPTNPRILHVEFVSESTRDKALSEEKQDIHVKIEAKDNRRTVVESREALAVKGDRRRKLSGSGEKEKSPSPSDRRKRRISPGIKEPKTREWDRNKNWRAGESPSREEPRRKRERSATPEKQKERITDEPPAKLLDELFRKTKAIPCVYWLPLTDEQVEQREKERKARIAARLEKERLEDADRERRRRERDRVSPEREFHRRR